MRFARAKLRFARAKPPVAKRHTRTRTPHTHAHAHTHMQAVEIHINHETGKVHRQPFKGISFDAVTKRELLAAILAYDYSAVRNLAGSKIMPAPLAMAFAAHAHKKDMAMPDPNQRHERHGGMLAAFALGVGDAQPKLSYDTPHNGATLICSYAVVNDNAEAVDALTIILEFGYGDFCEKIINFFRASKAPRCAARLEALRAASGSSITVKAERRLDNMEIDLRARTHAAIARLEKLPPNPCSRKGRAPSANELVLDALYNALEAKHCVLIVCAAGMTLSLGLTLLGREEVCIFSKRPETVERLKVERAVRDTLLGVRPRGRRAHLGCVVAALQRALHLPEVDGIELVD